MHVDQLIRMVNQMGSFFEAMPDRSEFDPRKFLKEATAAARDVCIDRFQAFGTAGMASRIKPAALQ
jgi:fructose-bisphosphate aldolase class II